MGVGVYGRVCINVCLAASFSDPFFIMDASPF